MVSLSQNVDFVQKIVLVSFRFSNIGIFRWDRPIPMLKEILKTYGFKTYLYIKVFGKDELWAIASLTENSKFESLKKERLVAYAASLEKSLPLDLMAIDKIVEGQFPVGYLFFKRKNKSISLHRIENLIKKKGIPFLVGEIDHPEGFSHFAAFAVGNKSLKELARLAHELMSGLMCEKWECFLGVEHVWEGYGEDLKDKMKTAKNLLKLINRWSHGIP
jgi:hypothetical protein